MAEEKEGATEGEAAPKPKKKLDTGILLGLVNSLLVLGVLGVAVYTKLIFKKKEIKESVEMEKIIEEDKAPEKVQNEKVLVNFDQMTVNIATDDGKPHYLTVLVALEANGAEAAAAAKQLKAVMTDKIISAVGKKKMNELSAMQGKLILKTELIREFNKIMKDAANIELGVTDIFFSEFMIQ